MPNGRSRSFAGNRRTPRRRLVWNRGSATVAALASGTNAVTGLVPSLTFSGSTIVRTHIMIQVPAVVAADFTQMGLAVVRSSDPGNSIPDPITDLEIDWMFNKTLYASSVGSGATIVTTNLMEFDIKSKRRIHEQGQLLALCLKNENAAAATYRFSWNVLLALP